MRTIKYSVTDKEYAIIHRCAQTKGHTPSSMTKHAVFQFVSRFPPKGVFDDNYEQETRKAAESRTTGQERT